MPIYFVADSERKFLKLGYSKNVEQRLKTLQGFCPLDLELVGYVGGTIIHEKAIHSRMESSRIRGEWYRLDDPVRILIDDLNSGWLPEVDVPSQHLALMPQSHRMCGDRVECICGATAKCVDTSLFHGWSRDYEKQSSCCPECATAGNGFRLPSESFSLNPRKLQGAAQ